MQNNLITEIKKSINEELGISRMVTTETNELISNIVKNAKDKLKHNNIKNGTFDTTVFGVPLTVEYQILYMNDISDVSSFNVVNPGFSNINFLSTTICYIKKQNQYIDYDGTTQHELEHVYQELMSGRNFSSKEKSKNIYITAVKLAKSTDVFEKIVGYVVYYANKFEKDAFMHEIYRQLMDNWQIDPFETIKKSVVYRNVNVIDNIINNLTDYQLQKIEEIISFNFNKQFNWWLNIAKKVVKAYTNKVGKVIVKAQNDIAEKKQYLTFNDTIDKKL